MYSNVATIYDEHIKTSKVLSLKSKHKVIIMNLFEIYEAAMQNAASNEIIIDVEYIQGYAEGALDLYVSESLAQKAVDAHNAWLDSERGSNNYDHLVKFELQDYEIVN